LKAQQDFNSSTRSRLIRLLVSAPFILLCLWGIWSAGGIGLSRLFSDYAALTGTELAAAQAVQLTPSDPEAHFTRGLVSTNAGVLDEGIQEYERAVTLRPRDYYLWLVLADVRDQAGDQDGALAASREAVRLAPFYAQPRWQLGNMLFRAGHPDEAFAELRHAASSDPSLLPAVIDLAWGSSQQDVGAVEAIIQPQTNAQRLALARFFARHDKTADAVRYFRASGDVSDKERGALLNDLFAAKRFRDAYDVWSSGHQSLVDENGKGVASVIDGGFEKMLNRDNAGFGWQLSRDATNVSFSIDDAEPHAGARSLRLDWKGDYNPAAPIISQLVLVEPKTHYRLRFAARGQEIVTGGLPLMLVKDASGKAEDRPMAQSKMLPQGTSPWNDYTLEFNTSNETSAILISLQRNCAGGPCPIFGRLWLDDFSLQKI
jgi:tetratricopeptide (TPR) repeat protein